MEASKLEPIIMDAELKVATTPALGVAATPTLRQARRPAICETSTRYDAPPSCTNRQSNFTRLTILVCIVCLIWNLDVFTPVPYGMLDSECPCQGISHCVCIRSTICAFNIGEIILLLIARLSAFGMYPLLMLIFLTKCNNIRAFLNNSFLAELFPFYDVHNFHTRFGRWIFILSLIHTVAHVIRWSLQEDKISLLVDHVTGWTGLITFSLLFVIVLPMQWEWLKSKMRFEVRKGLHCLSIVWGLVLMFHSPKGNILIIVGIAVCLYILDSIYGLFARTYHIQSSMFCRLETAVQLTFKKPPGFDLSDVGYIYICIPWISLFEWHAFSVYPHLSKPDYACVCIAISGDWTAKLHQELVCPSVRPCWVYGPFPSPFGLASLSDDVICVASGIGITPAICVLHKYAETRRLNLVWICRDPSMVEFFLELINFDTDAYSLIYYTGSRPLVLPDTLPSMVFIFQGRPDLEKVLLAIMGEGKEEKLQLIERATEMTKRSSSAVALSTLSGHEFTSSHLRPLRPSVFHAIRQSAVDIKLTLKNRPCYKIIKMLDTYTPEELFFDAISRNLDQILSRQNLLSFQGLEVTLVTHLGNLFPREEVQILFDSTDADRSGNIDFLEFKVLLKMLRAFALEENDKVAEISNVSVVHDIIETNQAQLTLNRIDQLCELPTKDAAQPDLEAAPRLSDIGSVERNSRSLQVMKKDWEIVSQKHMDPSFAGGCSFHEFPVLYCGGSAPVVADLKVITQKYSIPFWCEKFDW